jgi:hypothetical protein
MWGYSLSSINRIKTTIPYLFASKAHRTMWIIGALAVLGTTSVVGWQARSTNQPPNNTAKSIEINVPPASVKTSDQSSTVETVTNTSPQADQSRPSSSVRVNNQTIPIPPNGSVHKTIQSNDGQTKLNVSVDASSSTSSQSNSSVQLNVTSSQEATIDNSE